MRGQGRRTVQPSVPAHSPWGTVAVAAAGVTLLAAGVGVVTLGLRDGGAAEGPLVQAAASPLDRDIGSPSDYAFANLDGADAGQVQVARELAPSIVRVDSGVTRGSGIIIADDGIILTSASVVGDHGEVAVGLGDGRLLTATVLGSDALTGVAVVDLPGAGYAETDLTDVPLEQVLGEEALAFGVDELGRVVLGAGDVAPTVDRSAPPGETPIDGVLVVDTAVDPVAWGGPLVDEAGTLVGLNVWTNGGNTYAVPASTLRKAVDDILAFGVVQHTWLGFVGVTQLENDWAVGVRVTSVAPDGPAARGLQVHDLVVALDDQRISQMSALAAELRRHDPGDVVEVSVRRAGSSTPLTQSLVLALRPPDV